MTDYQSILHELEAHTKKRHSRIWLGIFLFFIGSFFTVQQNGSFLKISVLPTIQHAPFDGTVSPVKLAPDWVHLTAQEYKLPYNQIPADKLLPMPAYKPEELSIPVTNLQWNNPDHNRIRNAKITYSTPYMGSYRLNGKEYDGSHIAVDIKVPDGTPVVAIANGAVIKVSNVSSGFGKHIVLQHNNVPSLNDPNVTITLYSSYSHLSSPEVIEGQVVTKGQILGRSGQTGFATTPHVHFQIDNDDAPFHPYWPFTFKEADDAGYNFVEALNAGIGKERGLLMTLSPVKYIEKYQNYSSSSESTPVSTPPVVIPEPFPVVAQIVTASRFDFQNNASYLTTDVVNITLTAKDTQGNSLSSFDGDVTLLLTGDIGMLSKAKLVSADFVNGQVTINVENVKAGTGHLVVLYQGGRFSSNDFQVVDNTPITEPAAATPEVQPIAVTEPTSVPIPEPVVAVAPPETSTPAPMPIPEVKPVHSGQFFADISSAHPYFSAISFLKDKSFIQGYDDGTFQSKKKVTRVEALKMILMASEKNITDIYGVPAFPDIDYKAWYGPYVVTGFSENIVRGYDDQTFKPGQRVNRAEFLKMLLTAMKIYTPGGTEKPYLDVAVDSWFLPFAAYAKQNNLLPTHINLFKANEEIDRGEVAEIIYRVLQARANGGPFVADAL